MGYIDFTHKFKNVRSQYNILAIVGNGFDIQALMDLGSPTDTRYESFYYYLRFRKFDQENRLVQKMEHLHGIGAENWSDVESAINDLLSVDKVDPRMITSDLHAIQREFSSFLDQTATPNLLAQLGDLSVENKWTMNSFTEFLGDIDDEDEYGRMILPTKVDIGDLFNFQFINFNYTTLLDDYLFLDQSQFDPHPYSQSDRNIDFHPNPWGFSGGQGERKDFRMVSYLVSEVVHPHGVQYTPRSLLFGIDSANHPAHRLTKPYWAQNEVKYGDLFPETDLFIVFGCSLGDTDGWWWRNIAAALSDERRDSELILYWWCAPSNCVTEADVRNKFAKSAGKDGDMKFSQVFEDRVRIILYGNETERAWLNTNPATAPSWISKKTNG